MRSKRQNSTATKPAIVNEGQDQAAGRSNCYGLLALVFGNVPTREAITQLRSPPLAAALSRLGCDVGEDLAGEIDAVTQRFREEYTGIFVGPGLHVSLYASLHHRGEGSLWGDSTVRVKRFIEGAGLSFSGNWDSIPDHIKIELEFMQRLIQREQQAWEEKGIGSAKRCLQLEKEFIEEYLNQWIPSFCDRVMDEATLNFYREMARLTKDYIRLEETQISELLAAVEKLPGG